MTDMNDLSIKEVIDLMAELKSDLLVKHNEYMKVFPESKKAGPTPSIQIYSDGSIRLKRSDMEFVCPNIWPPYSDQKIRDMFDMVLSRGRDLVVDEGLAIGESLVLGENCHYVDS